MTEMYIEATEEDARNEVWRLCPSYPLYEVSSLGRTRRVGKLRAMKQRLAPNGYPQVTLSMHNRLITRYVHTLVAESFIGPPPINHYVSHLDGNKADNRPENLAYVQGFTYSGTSAPNLGSQAANTRRSVTLPGWYLYANTDLLQYWPDGGADAAEEELEAAVSRARESHKVTGGFPMYLVTNEAGIPLKVIYLIHKEGEQNGGADGVSK